jgi:hypothetical protein
VIVLDILRGRRQHMWIMNLVWPMPDSCRVIPRTGGYSTKGSRKECEDGKSPAFEAVDAE